MAQSQRHLPTNNRNMQKNSSRHRRHPGYRGDLINQTNSQTIHGSLQVAITTSSIVYKLCITKDRQENRVMMVYKDYSALLKTALL